MSETKTHDWDLVIYPQNNLLDLKLKDVWQYRDLLMMFVKRDFVSFYKQTILGPLWFFIQPLFTTIVFTFVFGGLAGISTDGIPPLLFYLSGITAWNYFADCLTKTSTVFKDNANIFGKVYFPRLILPLSIIVSNLVKFGVQFLLFLCILFYYSLQGTRLNITWFLALFPLLILLMALLGLGLGLIITAMTTKYRDLTFLVVFGIQLLMYATTVIYPLSAAPDKYKKIIMLNPMTSIIESFRYAFFGKGEVSFWSLVYTIVITLIVMIFGIIIFNKTEKKFIDTV